MSDDDLKHLADALRAAPEAPDPAAKAAHLRLAMENFDRHQETAAHARPTPDRPEPAGLKKGVDWMLNVLTSRGGLAATTSLVALGLVAYVVIPQGGIPHGTAPDGFVLSRSEAPVARQEVQDHGEAEEEVYVEDVPIIEPMVEPMMAAPEADMASGTLQRRAEASGGLYGKAATPGTMPAPADDLSVTPPAPDTETFANEAPNPLKIVAEDPVSTFSIDVDTASYAVVRSSLMNGYLPDPQSVRVEEMVNYFPYTYPAPEAGSAPFKPTLTLLPTPWNADTQLVHIGIQGQLPALEDRPPLNLVFLIDTSGSMDSANKLPLLKQSFRLLLSQLRPEDQVAIVTYAGSAGRVLDPTPAKERSTILAALDRLSAGGSTAGQAGLQQAYATAEAMAQEGDVTRVILATDGDFNVGISDPDALKSYIEDKRDSGTYLSVLGFGRGNLDDATMQALAQNGNGTAAYIDTLSEAQKVLVDQLSGALFPIADDVKIQVEFNPAQIAEYRLIGYETRALTREDFNNDAVDAGEIGAGHSVTAIYEVTPVGSAAVLHDDLRYGTPAEAAAPSDELGFLKLRYKAPGAKTSQLIETPILPEMGQANADIRFAAAIAGFGQLLRDGKYLGGWGYADAIALANANKGADAYGYRAEAVTLMRLAETLSQQ